MYRLSLFNGYTGDLVHKFTLDYYGEALNLISQGWGYEGIHGYVYTTATPQVYGGTILGLRCPSYGSCLADVGLPNARDYYFGNVELPTTVKTGNTQRVSFIFFSPDFFGEWNGHIPITLHGRYFTPEPIYARCSDISEIGSGCLWHRGLGMYVESNGNARTEAWWVGGNTSEYASQNYGSLQNNRSYYAEINVRDDGYISYTITDLYTYSVVKAEARNTNGMFAPGGPQGGYFPAELTGINIRNATDTLHDYTFYITNLSVSWFNSY
jgi:hypothetical protein